MTSLLQQAIDLAKAGRREEAEALLRQVLAQQPDNEAAWMWLSGVTRDQAVKREALTKVLAINPHNRLAQKGLALFSGASTGSTLPNTLGSGKPPVSGSPPGEPEPGAASPSPPQPPSSKASTDFDLGDEEPPMIEATPSSPEPEADLDWETSLPWEELPPWEDTSSQPEIPAFSFEPETETSPPEEVSFDKGAEVEVRLDEPESEPADEKKINQPDPLALAKQRQQHQQRLLIYITLVFILAVVAAVSLTMFDDAVGRYTFLPAPARLERVVPEPQNNEATVNFKGYPGARVRIEWTQADEAETCDDSGKGLLVAFQTGETSEPVNRIFCREGNCAYERELNQLPITNVKVTYICGQDAVITLFKAAN